MRESASGVGLGLLFVAELLVGAESPKTDSGAVVQDLLAMLSPAKFEKAMEYHEPMPPDPEDLRAGNELALLGYWAEGFRQPDKKPGDPPTAALLRAATAYPRFLPDLLPALPFEGAVFAGVMNIYDQSAGESCCGESWTSSVHDWLMMHSEYFRDDLIAEAKLAIDKDGYVAGSDRLVALAALDWDAASSILEEHARGSAPRTAALALAMLYKQAAATHATGAAETLRSRLLHLAEDGEAPGRVVDTAIEALLTTEWEGRDDWYLRLLENPALADLQDDLWGFAPLAFAVEKDPDIWIPRLSELIESSNRALHNQAVELLVRFHLTDAREDALRPLLPWIADPTWSDASDRLRLIQSVDLVGLREAIPGLIFALEHDDEWSQYIADSLGDLGAREAIPALRAALQRDIDFPVFSPRQSIIRALVNLRGFTTAELTQAIQRFAEESSTSEGREAMREAEAPLDLALQVGKFIGRSDFQPSEELARSLLGSLPELQATKPLAAQRLEDLLAGWSARALDEYFAEALLSSKLDAARAASVLMRRKAFRGNTLGLLRKSLRREGMPRGFAAILLEDTSVTRQILKSGTAESQVALFAAARIVDEELPLSLVAPLLEGADTDVSKAAERYLETNDRPAAREILWRKYPGRAWILGHSVPGDPAGSADPALSKRELALRQELFRADGPQEIFAWVANGHWSGGSWREIRLSKSGAQLACEDGSRPLTASEIAPLLNLVAQRSIDDLGYFSTHVTDCTHVEYLHLTRNRGRRIVMYCPVFGRGSDHYLLNEIFEGFSCSVESAGSPEDQ